MILIIGGRCSGKLAYVKGVLGYGQEKIAMHQIEDKPVLYGLQNVDNIEKISLETLLQKEVIVCDEIGCGIVPTEKQERARRETVGRLCIRLAEAADQVVRMTAGIPQRIK